MRKDFTLETREIDDAELDNVSGGILGLQVGDVVGSAVGTATGTVGSVAPLLPVGQVTGLVPAQVSGILPQATGLIAGL